MCKQGITQEQQHSAVFIDWGYTEQMIMSQRALKAERCQIVALIWQHIRLQWSFKVDFLDLC